MGTNDSDETTLRSDDLRRLEITLPKVGGIRADAIGPYKVLGLLGEGAFGVVYMAEQTEPIRRRVALKIIKPGMDSKAVIARFEAEERALALMDHPNVAKVFDAGMTEQGRPYFVMEHVPGVRITEHCDRQHLGIEERLDLFMLVCDAVQHAHQKGIIHRDIKPSNILVAFHNGRSVPKVIDFGVAKAIEHRLTEKTLYTEQGALVGGSTHFDNNTMRSRRSFEPLSHTELTLEVTWSFSGRQNHNLRLRIPHRAPNTARLRRANTYKDF